jgi:hypothetical protein
MRFRWFRLGTPITNHFAADFRNVQPLGPALVGRRCKYLEFCTRLEKEWLPSLNDLFFSVRGKAL